LGLQGMAILFPVGGFLCLSVGVLHQHIDVDNHSILKELIIVSKVST